MTRTPPRGVDEPFVPTGGGRIFLAMMAQETDRPRELLADEHREVLLIHHIVLPHSSPVEELALASVSKPRKASRLR